MGELSFCTVRVDLGLVVVVVRRVAGEARRGAGGALILSHIS